MINGRAIVTVHICTVTVAIVYKYTILHPLMWVFFLVKMYKMGTFFYFILEDFTYVDVVTLSHIELSFRNYIC